MDNTMDTIYSVGQDIKILDQIDQETQHKGKIIFIEYDTDLNFTWIYVKADQDSLNTNYDPKFVGGYWRVIESISPFIISN